jgi:6,7-dimethyl-8-ribityllumazine synthase
MKKIEFKKLNGSKFKVGIAVARWNSHITQNLLSGCKKALEESELLKKNVIVAEVPGSFELPFAAQELIKKHRVDGVICLGALIKGETMHFEYIASAVSSGIMNVQLKFGKPVIFGVLTCLNESQAIARSTGKNNHGYWWGKTLIEMLVF